MAFSPHFLDELRARVPVSAVAGRRVKLIKKGREFTGLCPFHAEKSPSFFVNDDKQFYHCFGCGAHGTVFDFVMNTEGLGFPETVEKLAAEAGLEVPRSTPEEAAREQQRLGLYEACEQACVWFETQLRSPVGAAGLAYLKSRGLTDSVIRTFRLGFAPDSREALRTALETQGFARSVLIEAGLLKLPDPDGPAAGRAPYDAFRGRVMFPITDRRGRVIAFGGRTMGDGQPKYLNSSETPIFHKRQTLFGFATARRAALEAGELVVVEGYMDVIALHRAGIAHAVAPLGTALTEEQLSELWRTVAEPTVCFDGDAAGQKAARRAAEVALPLLKPAQSLKFCVLPPGQDPDDLLKSGGAEAVRAALAKTRALSDVVWEAELDGRDLSTPERRAGFKQAIRERVLQIADRTVQEQYRRHFDDLLAEVFGGAARREGGSRTGAKSDYRDGRVDGYGHGYNDGFADGRGGRYRRAARQASFAGRGGLVGAGVRSGTAALRRKAEAALLATAINHPALAIREAEALAQAEIHDPPLNQLRACLLDVLATQEELDSRGLRRQLSHYGVGTLIDEILTEETYIHARFAKPGADLDSAEAGFSELLDRMALRPGADQERRADGEAVADDLTEENWERLQAKLVVAGETQ